MVTDPVQILPFITDEGPQPEGQQSHYPLNTKTHLLGWKSTRVSGTRGREGYVGWGGVGLCASPPEKRQILFKICLHLVSAINHVNVQPHGVIHT